MSLRDTVAVLERRKPWSRALSSGKSLPRGEGPLYMAPRNILMVRKPWSRALSSGRSLPRGEGPLNMAPRKILMVRKPHAAGLYLVAKAFPAEEGPL
jgi:hypothetical protein